MGISIITLKALVYIGNVHVGATFHGIPVVELRKTHILAIIQSSIHIIVNKSSLLSGWGGGTINSYRMHCGKIWEGHNWNYRTPHLYISKKVRS